MIKLSKTFAFVCAVALLGAGKANANVLLTVEVSGAGPQNYNLVVDALGNYSQTDTINGVTFTISGNTNHPGDGTSGELLSNSVEAANTAGGTRTLTITTTTDTPFTNPTGGSGMLLTSTFSSTKSPTAFTFQSYVKDKDGNWQSGGPQTVPNTITGSEVTTNFLRGPAGYELKSVTTVVLTAGSRAQSNGAADVTLATPEPSTVALALCGLPMLALARRLRRKAD